MMSKYKAHYWRYHQHYVEDCDTLEEAKDFLYRGEDNGELSTELIETPDGVISGDNLHPIFGKRPKSCPLLEATKTLNKESQDDT